MMGTLFFRGCGTVDRSVPWVVLRFKIRVEVVRVGDCFEAHATQRIGDSERLTLSVGHPTEQAALVALFKVLAEEAAL